MYKSRGRSVVPAAFIIYVIIFSHIGINIMRAVYNNEIMEYFK